MVTAWPIYSHLQATWIPSSILPAFTRRSKSYQNSVGEVSINSMVHRTQERNLAEAKSKLLTLLRDAEDESLVCFADIYNVCCC